MLVCGFSPYQQTVIYIPTRFLFKVVTGFVTDNECAAVRGYSPGTMYLDNQCAPDPDCKLR
jgi:hypothetical protein